MIPDGQKMTHPRRFYIGAALLVMVGLVIGLGLSARFNLPWTSIADKGALSATVSSAPIPESPFVGVVDKALPAVVFVDVRKKAVAGESDDPQEEMLRRFFGQNPRQPRSVPSSGSGFIIDSQGHVLTNNHVVANAEEITVTLNDKRAFKATVVGTDTESDVAVIKIEGERLPVLPLGDSDRIRVGDWAIAIGNPLGMLRGSVTVGIISAQGRTNLNIFGGTPAFQDFIQTDASINFGNSGGPLCNIRGEVIGINTAINPSGQGIGFAIPINLAKHVADQLVAHGKVQRALMGVTLDELTPDIAEGLGIKGVEGALVTNVVPGQPADQAGLKRNDVIVEYEGKQVTDMQKFRLRVADTQVGKKVALVAMRDGKRLPFTVTLTERTTEMMAAFNRQPVSPAQAEAMGGITVRDLTADEMADAQVKSGVMVTDVKEGSPAEDKGIQAGDLIEEVSAKPVANAAAFSRLMRDAKASTRKNAILLVNRNNRTQFVAVPLSE